MEVSSAFSSSALFIFYLYLFIALVSSRRFTLSIFISCPPARNSILLSWRLLTGKAVLSVAAQNHLPRPRPTGEPPGEKKWPWALELKEGYRQPGSEGVSVAPGSAIPP
jgi:hypothetical protein